MNTALQSATNNAEDKRVDAELELQRIMESMAEESDITKCIEMISEAFDKIEEAELSLKRIEQIKKWLNEDMKEIK